MKLGYITFSSEEQQLVHDVLQQISQGAIDELGLGRIRDAFSDKMFPGMSTLHRKSKYFVLLPALYAQLSKTNIKDAISVSALIRKWEINMTLKLLAGSDGAKDNTGITGSSLGIEKLKEGRFVKITPTSIYLSSLKYFGLVDDGMSIQNLIYRQALANKESNLKKNRTKDEILEDPDGEESAMGIAQSFFPFTGYDFSSDDPIDLKLTKVESDIIRQKIIKKCREDGEEKLYSFLLSHDEIDIVGNFFEMKDEMEKFPPELQEIYNLAYDFSKWAHLMNTYYRYAFNLKAGNKPAADSLKDHISNILKTDGYPDANRIEQIINYVHNLKDFNDANCVCKFCLSASELLGKPEREDELIDLIGQRERAIKHSHYKIGNDRYKNTEYTGNPGYYTYRWNEIVYSMINDIRNPQDEQ